MATTLIAREIVKSVRSLPKRSRDKVMSELHKDLMELLEGMLSEEQVNQILFERGVIGNLPNRSDYTDADDDFEPIRIKGKPLSQTILEDREHFRCHQNQFFYLLQT